MHPMISAEAATAAWLTTALGAAGGGLASPGSFADMDLGEGAKLHSNPLGATWHDNPLSAASSVASPTPSPRPARLLLPQEAAEADSKALVSLLASLPVFTLDS